MTTLWSMVGGRHHEAEPEDLLASIWLSSFFGEHSTQCAAWRPRFASRLVGGGGVHDSRVVGSELPQPHASNQLLAPSLKGLY